MKHIVTIGFFILLFIACSKDSYNPVRYSHRIEEMHINESIEDSTFKVTFEYDNENLTNLIIYKFNNRKWYEEKKCTFSYENNLVTAIYYVFAGKWYAYKKSEYSIDKDRVLEEKIFAKYTNGEYYEKLLFEYKYSGEKLTEWYLSEVQKANSLFKATKKGELKYSNHQLAEYCEYDINKYDSLLQITKELSNSKNDWITYQKNSSNEWEESIKIEKLIEDSKVIQKNAYSWITSTKEWEDQNFASIYYLYDANGFLSEVRNGEVKISYHYKEGHSNPKLFWYYPFEIINDEPTFKSVNQDDHLPYYKSYLHKFNFK